MNKTFDSLLKKMSPERRVRVDKKVVSLNKEMALFELRQALDMTQTELAGELKMKQAAISKFEKQSDIYISTLRKILAGMGGELIISARFSEGEVRIRQFDDVRKDIIQEAYARG
ncbi:MAG: XRE family transcriptional regulator [bacterium]